MPKVYSEKDLARENSELKKELKSLKEEIEIIKQSSLAGESYYKDRFYTINENANDVVYGYNIKEKRYEYVSPQVKNIFGYSPEEIKKSLLLTRRIIHPDSFEAYKNIWKNILKGKVPEYFEIKIIKKSGEISWISQKNLVIRNNKKEIVALEGIITDVTDRKVAEEKLIESEAQKKAIFNNFPHLAWLKDCNGVYLSVNEAFVERYGEGVDCIIGKTDKELYKPEIALKYRKEDLQVIHTQKKLSIEEKIDDTFWETYKAPVFSNLNEVIGVTGIALNITSRVRNEEEVKDYSERLAVQNVKLKLVNEELKAAKEKAEEADRLKSAFLANMSHEIRTPMNAILGFATLLRDRKLIEEKRVEFINLINANCRQLLHIISDIIDISKIEANQITLFKKDFNINKALRVLKQNFENQILAQKKNISIALKTGLPDGDAEVVTDKVRLEQVLSNLLSNAIKFTDKGRIEFGYTYMDLQKNIVFYVKDTGIGLMPKQEEVIFERFRQVSSAYNKQYGGTGLGLSISKGLTEKLGGKIWVKSFINKGSTFYVSIPFEKGIKIIQDTLPERKTYTWKDRIVLIVEDELHNYTLLENIIYPTKAKIIWVKNGLDAIAVCKKRNDIDLVLMDVKLPDINGLEATKQIKKLQKDLPIIAQTAFAMPNDAENCLNAGCDDYLAKPLGVDDILQKINHHIHKFSILKKNKSSSESRKSVS
jgi:PAS domain S-box-containing protein